MRLLVIGGTRFVGKHVVLQAVERGHDVTVFHRGQTEGSLPDGVEHRLGDRDADMSALAEGEWDATIDACAYVPRQVDALADVLGGRGGRHLMVSSVSVYATPDGPGVSDDADVIRLGDPTTEDVTAETYGGLKVLCEEAAIARHGDATVVVRPTFVVGPDDYTWRFPWWVKRVSEGGTIPVPGPRDNPAQVIDARDMGAWMVRVLEHGDAGVFNGCGPRVDFTWGEQIDAIAEAVAPAGTELVWLDPEVVESADLPPMALPLWAGTGPQRWMMTADPARAIATGLEYRPLATTVGDTLDWIVAERSAGRDAPDGIGLTPDQEAALRAVADTA